MNAPEPVSTDFHCAKIDGAVVLSGTRRRLHGGGYFPLTVAQAYTRCSGMPACGCILGSLPCPYKQET
jgi:hypothetical protein